MGAHCKLGFITLYKCVVWNKYNIITVTTQSAFFQLSDTTTYMLKSNLTISQMEELALGRILSKYVPEIINSRDSTKTKKCDTILQTTNTWNYLKSNRHVIGLILKTLKENHTISMGGNKMFIDECHNFLCCVPDGITSTDLLLHFTKLFYSSYFWRRVISSSCEEKRKQKNACVEDH